MDASLSRPAGQQDEMTKNFEVGLNNFREVLAGLGKGV
jgi:hypothetical protein